LSDHTATAAESAAPRTFGADVARFGAAIAVAVALGAVQVFVLPRRVDVATYGQYRLYLVYFGYLGILSFGLADGAFVRWAGQPPGVIREEWRRVLLWLFTVQGTVLALALAAALTITGSLPRTYIIAFAVSALCSNVALLMSYALQAAGDFQGAGQIAVLSPAIFVATMLVVPLNTLPAVLAAHIGSAGLAALAGIVRVARIVSPAAGAETARDPLRISPLVGMGVPVLGANLAAVASQFADRVLVSLAVPMTSLAMYGFASSVSVAAGFATQTLSRVALSHAARRGPDERARVLSGVYDLMIAGYGVALAGLPLFEHIVSISLPAYVLALPIVRALVCGSLFGIATHVVLVGTLQSYGMVRRQFALELGGAALVVIACSIALYAAVPLWGVAAAAAAAAAAIWVAGVILVRRSVPAAREQRTIRFAILGMAQIGALLAALVFVDGWMRQTVLYLVLASVPTVLAARAARAHWRR
jgi:O-antigen/teichoic acid export membrane protein